MKAYEPGTVIDAVALFPLPEVVLFPGMLLPLHVFELRYRAMTEHVLAGSRQLCVVLINGKGSVDQHGQPAIAEISGIGEIVDHQSLADGRYNIMLSGIARVKLVELPFIAPFRRARATVLASNEGATPNADLATLVYGATRFAARMRERDPKFRLALPRVPDAGTTADSCAHQLIIEADERQKILETLDVPRRVRFCIEALAVQEAMLQTRHGAPS